jgi:hypothetical protein
MDILSGVKSLLTRYIYSLSGKKENNEQIKKVTIIEKKLNETILEKSKKKEMSRERFHKLYSNKKWFLTKEKYSALLTGLYYLKYTNYWDVNEDGLEEFYTFYSKILSFIGKFYLHTHIKKKNDDNVEQIAQVQFMKFLNKITKTDACIIKNIKSVISVINYTLDTAVVETDPEEFKRSLEKCKKRSIK